MHNNGTLQASMVARNYGILPDPIGTLADDFVASSTVGYGPVGWRSPAIESAIAGYMGSSDPLKRAAWRQEITGIIQTEMPVIPLSWYDQVVAVSKRVQGVVIDPFEATYGIADMRWSQ
jgi:peptide/nickel transport system substrate-binding protein